MVAEAFTKQMEEEGLKLRDAKQKLEQMISNGGSLAELTTSLDQVNEMYKTASQQVRKHTVPPKPKAKGKAAAKSAN